uniref:Secreted protein n=1 Tax=Parascaris univalens TaxID=6257 RepID=A0A915BBD2_PARUN
MLSKVFAILFVIHSVHGHVCFHCVSYAHFLSPTLRRQLGAQSDIFHWPIDASSPNCAAPSKVDHQVQAHICTKHSLCVTLSPNLANVSFVVRGCLEQVLVTRLRLDNRLLSEGYLSSALFLVFNGLCTSSSH